MGDEEQVEGERARPVANPVPREKPVIEGRAEEIEGKPAESEPAESQPAGTGSFDALPAPPEAEVTPPEPPADTPQESDTPHEEKGPPAPRAPIWPFAAAILLAAVLALAGAFGLHRLDKDSDRSALAKLQSRVATLEQRPSQTGAEGSLADRDAALETSSADVKSSMSALRAELEKLGAPKPGSVDLAPLESRVSALEGKLAALGSEIGGLAEKLDAEKGQVSAAASRVSQSATARADSAALAILSANLLHKVEAGAPYKTELDALAGLGFDKAKLAPLEDAAASGVATPAALAKQFAGLKPAMLASEPQPPEHGFFDHLVKGAERLVRVEKIGERGNDLAGRIARIEAALSTGAVDEAYRQWTDLPDAARAKSSSFGAAAKARIEASAAAREINGEAMAALAKARS